jgi:hypothetical protein
MKVTFTVSGACSYSSSTGLVSFTGVGTCTISASAAATATYSAAVTVTQSFPVAKGASVLAFTSQPPTNAIYGGFYDPTLTTTPSGQGQTITVTV